jgi:hypothetical protein
MYRKNTSKKNFISELDVETPIKESDSYYISDDYLLIVNRKNFKQNFNIYKSKLKRNRKTLNRGIFLPLDNFTY